MTEISSVAHKSIAPEPPVTEKRPQEKLVHGIRLVDEYAWLKADNWQEVLRDPSALPKDIRSVLEAENAYSKHCLEPTAELQKKLIAEMRGRIKEDDADVPASDGDWLYYDRHRQGGQHPLICRMPRAGGDEVIMLDGDEEGQGKAFFDIGETSHSPDHGKLAWSLDAKGSELYSIFVRDLTTGKEAADVVLDTDGTIVWMADSLGFYYVRVDDNHRTAQVFRHRIGTEPSADVLVLEELDPKWFVHLKRSRSRAYAIVCIADHDSAECHLIDLADAKATPRMVEARKPGIRYDVEHRGDKLYIRTNAGEAEDFKIVSAPLATPAAEFWHDEVPYKQGTMVVAQRVFADYHVRLEREGGLPRIVVRSFDSGEEHAIAFAEEAYHLGLGGQLEFQTTVLRFSYSSMTTPTEIYDYDLATHERELRKRQVIPSGHDPAHYVTRRLFATAHDGEQVPISILHRKDLVLDGSAPLLLYGYGAYGTPMPAAFGANRLSLVDRGFVYAIAHIRGGTDKGWHWYTDGKLEKKPNTFSDFVAAGRHLASLGYTRTGRIVAHGGSAGGMLMGASVNLAPELFAGVIADVPFVDVINTMLDADLPLTPPEWLEWGNPILDEKAFAAMRAYSPYDNVAAKDYPPILALGGLTDPRVTYWEPVKWVSRLRAMMTGGGPILLKTNMDAGHGGASGRFDHLAEIALEYAFALTCVEGIFSSAPDAKI